MVMTHTHWLTAVCCLLALTLTACSEQARSRLAGNNSGEQDVEEILIRQRESIKAENAVIAVVKADTGRWAQHEFGWWYRYTSKSPLHINYTRPPLPVDTCYWIHESVYTLDGSKLLHDAVRLYDNRDGGGKHPEPFVYQMMLEEMVAGDTVLLLVPWVMAYGQQGNAYVPPLTNCRILLTLHSSPCTDAALITDTDNNIIIVPTEANQYETFYPVYTLPDAPDDRSYVVQPE